MSELAWLTAFLAGLLGSAHCLGMCGGIAAALGATSDPQRRVQHALLYQAGRLASYSVAGALAGGVGAAAGLAFAASRWSEVLRLATAATVVVIGLDLALGATRARIWLRAPERWGARIWRGIGAARMVRTPRPAGAGRSLLLGLLWGWLPCGLVYSALIIAAAAGGPLRGSVTMAAFGLGTLPAMSGLSFLGGRLPRPDGSFARLLGAALVACGLWTAALPLAALSGAPGHTHHLHGDSH